MIKVKKRTGLEENLSLDKIHQILFFACDGLTGVSVSEIEMRSQIQFYQGISTKTIHDILIKAAAELISVDTPNYQYVAGRLINYSIRKEVYGQYEPIDFITHLHNTIKLGVYDDEILTMYSTQELEELGRYIKHKRDDKFTFVAMEQWRGKYLLKDRVSDRLYESPQMAYMMIAATLFGKYKEKRIHYVKKFYDAVSNFDISLPTPIMAGVRTKTRQFSSCVVMSTDDTLDSIATVNHSIIRYVSRRAGLGVNYGRVRALGSAIRGGEAKHTGVLPFLKSVEASVKSCSQGGVRGGAATVYFPMWHYEYESLVVLKNNQGTVEQRVRKLDYCFQINKTLYDRLVKGKNITLFSPSDVPGLYDAFCADQEKFEKLYLKYENDPSIRKKTIPAVEAFSMLMNERAGTGRIYIQNIDHTNTHSTFDESVAPIEQSNLCLEIALPTKPLKHIDDEDGIISLCTLAAVNFGNFNEPHEMEEACDLAVRALDALLDYQDYPIKAAELSTMGYRPLGVGIVNFAYFLARRGLKYDESAFDTVNTWAEAWSYYLMKSSVQLAKEQGKCKYFDNLKYSKGILPIDTYKKSIDEYNSTELKMDWETLRSDIKQYGIRNATLTALMPAETSAQISNSTNGIEKVRNLITKKVSKDGILKQVVPEIAKLKNKYDLLWEQDSNDGYIKIVGILQKYIDQAISANTSYNPELYLEGKVPMSLLLKELLIAYKYGLKTLYYHNVNDGSGEIDIEKEMKKLEDSATILPPELEDDNDCDSCKI